MRIIHLLDDNTVLKISKTNHSNRVEWENWQLLKNTKWKKYFAPCIKLLKNGNLIMKYCEPINWKNKNARPCYNENQELLNTLVPNFLKDVYKHNFGWYQGRMVQFDYDKKLNIKNGMLIPFKIMNYNSYVETKKRTKKEVINTEYDFKEILNNEVK